MTAGRSPEHPAGTWRDVAVLAVLAAAAVTVLIALAALA